MLRILIFLIDTSFSHHLIWVYCHVIYVENYTIGFYVEIYIFLRHYFHHNTQPLCKSHMYLDIQNSRRDQGLSVVSIYGLSLTSSLRS